MTVGEVGPKCDRPAVGGDRLVEPALVPEGVAQVAVGLGKAGWSAMARR